MPALFVLPRVQLLLACLYCWLQFGKQCVLTETCSCVRIIKCYGETTQEAQSLFLFIYFIVIISEMTDGEANVGAVALLCCGSNSRGQQSHTQVMETKLST